MKERAQEVSRRKSKQSKVKRCSTLPLSGLETIFPMDFVMTLAPHLPLLKFSFIFEPPLLFLHKLLVCSVFQVQSAPSRQGVRGRRFVVDVRWGLQRCVGLVVNSVANVAGTVVAGRVDDVQLAPLPSTSALLELLELFELVSSSSSDCCTGRVGLLELILEGRSDAVAVGPVGPGFGGVGADLLVDE
eukprot:g49640.t1